MNLRRAAFAVVFIAAALALSFVGGAVASAGGARTASGATPPAFGGPLGPLLGVAPAPVRAADPLTSNQTYLLPYTSWNGKARYAVVLLPADYVPGSGELLPCVLNPHARSVTPVQSARHWRDLPSTRGFMVICADSAGRARAYDSWSAPGQVRDLGDLPGLVQQAMPWLTLDAERLYVVGCSMGGQETLSLVARHPDRYAAALSIDGLANLTARYKELGRFGPRLRKKALETRAAVRKEVGGTPAQVPFAYRQRSPARFARTLALSGVPLAIWWSDQDKWAVNQARTQTGKLCATLRRINPEIPLLERMTGYDHGVAMRRDTALAVDFLQPGGEWRTRPAASSTWEYRGWMRTATVWEHTFTVTTRPRSFWRVAVAPGRVTGFSPAGLTVRMPYADDRPSPATVVVDDVPHSIDSDDGTLTFTLGAGTSVAVINPAG